MATCCPFGALEGSCFAPVPRLSLCFRGIMSWSQTVGMYVCTSTGLLPLYHPSYAEHQLTPYFFQALLPELDHFYRKYGIFFGDSVLTLFRCGRLYVDLRLTKTIAYFAAFCPKVIIQKQKFVLQRE